jgi:TRAP-type C4-dicarboxylate transport system substrate-binding protein
MAASGHVSTSSARGARPFVVLLTMIAFVAGSTMTGKAEPIHLKLSFFGPENTRTFQAGVKPFVDGVNKEGKDLVVIDVYADGALGKAIGEQPALVLNGTADIAWVVPGQTPYRFPDDELLELPGLIRDTQEGTLAYAHLLAAGALRGYDAFYVIGAYTTDPTIIHSRHPITSLAGLAGLRIRSNNAIEAKALERLGATPTVLPVSQMADAIARSVVDAAALNPTPLFDFKVAPVALNHYLLRGGAAPLLLLMNRKKFDSLPQPAKALIAKYSGERAAAAWIELFGGSEKQLIETLRADPKRKVVEPSPSDIDAAQRIYRALIDDWATGSPNNRALLQKLEAELAKIRAAARR